MPKKNKEIREKENRYLPPSPLELAKLAALLNLRNDTHQSNARSAIQPRIKRPRKWESMIKAARFYGYAVYFHDRLSKLSQRSLLLLLLGPPSLHQPPNTLYARYRRRDSPDEARILYLEGVQTEDNIYKRDTADGSDPARNYLSTRAGIFDWKRAKTVQTMILRFCKDQAQKYNKENAEPIDKFERDAAQLAEEFGITIDELCEEHFAGNRPEKLTGKALYTELMKKIEVREDIPSKANRSTKESRLLGWSLPTVLLDDLIAMRRAMKKRPGGIEALDELP